MAKAHVAARADAPNTTRKTGSSGRMDRNAGDPAGDQGETGMSAIDPLKDFASAWLGLWRDLGNDVVQQPDGTGGYFIAEFAAEPFPRWQEQPPHRAIHNSEQHSGATRAMEVMLDTMPGGRAALRSLIGGAA